MEMGELHCDCLVRLFLRLIACGLFFACIFLLNESIMLQKSLYSFFIIPGTASMLAFSMSEHYNVAYL